MIRRPGHRLRGQAARLLRPRQARRASKIHKDVLNLVAGLPHHRRRPRALRASSRKVVKDIIRGLKDSLILDRFQSAGDIQRHLETLIW